MIRLPGEIRVAALGVGVGVVLGVVVAAASPLYTIAGLLALVALAGVFLDARAGLFGFVAIATLLPFGTIPLAIGVVKPTFLDASLGSVLLAWIFRLLADRRERLRATGLDLPVLLFLGVCITSFVLGTAYQTTTSDLRQFAELINATLFLFTVVHYVRDLGTVERLLLALVAGGTAAAAIGIVLYVLPPATATSLLGSLSRIGYPSRNILQYIASTSIQRAIGTSIDPNILGATLMMASVAAVGLLTRSGPIRRQGPILAGLAVMLVALLLTYSRGSLIGFLAGCAVIATLRERRLWLFGALIVVIGLLSGQLAGNSFVAHLQSGIEVRDKAAAMRLGEYKDALRLIAQYPWFGVGFGQAPDVDLYVGVSSIYLQLAEQIGLVGLGVWLWAIATILIRAVRQAIHRRDDASSLSVASLAALVSALVAGLFDHHFMDVHFPHVAAMVWLIVGLLSVSVRAELPADAERPR